MEAAEASGKVARHVDRHEADDVEVGHRVGEIARSTGELAVPAGGEIAGIRVGLVQSLTNQEGSAEAIGNLAEIHVRHLVEDPGGAEPSGTSRTGVVARRDRE